MVSYLNRIGNSMGGESLELFTQHFFDSFRRLIGQENFFSACTMHWISASDIRQNSNRMRAFNLFDIDDLIVFHHGNVCGLPCIFDKIFKNLFSVRIRRPNLYFFVSGSFITYPSLANVLSSLLTVLRPISNLSARSLTRNSGWSIEKLFKIRSEFLTEERR